MDHGVRLNHEVYGQQQLSLGRLSVIAGARFVHNGSFGNTGVPRVALSFRPCGAAISFPALVCAFPMLPGSKSRVWRNHSGTGPFAVIANPDLQPEKDRSFEAGFQQGFPKVRLDRNLLQQSVS